MYRYNYNGQEIIIRFTSPMQKKGLNKELLYKKIIAISDKIVDAEHGTSFIVKVDNDRLVVFTVQRGELLVISVSHIINNNHIFIEM